MFCQVHEPSRFGLSDFADVVDRGIMMAADLVNHRLCYFWLAYSGFE
jgi:hypothetical protein